MALQTRATEVLYGGAAGGGKSYLMRIAASLWAIDIPNLQVYLFRRLSPDLLKTHIEGPRGMRTILHPLVESGYCQIVQDEIRFWNNSRIFLCHCQDERDIYKYQGPEIHVLLIDELTQFTEFMYRFLRSRVRAVGLNLPERYEGLFPRILCATNPGNIGHLWVKNTWIDNKEPLKIYNMKELYPTGVEGGHRRMYIPARIEDNPTLEKDDPEYRQNLRGLGSPELVRAMELGDWNVVSGAYFPEFKQDLHVIDPFPIPEHWPRMRSMDWGSAKPFAIGWWAVSDGTIQGIPKNAIICYREWYGANGVDEGLGMTVEQVAYGIKQREGENEKFAYSVADPSIFKEDGGPSLAERFRKQGVIFRRGDRERLPGWDAVRQRLRGFDDTPMIYWFKTCLDTIRVLPTAQHDRVKPEDLDTKSEDHIPDMIRYFCMSRPYTTEKKEVAPIVTMNNMTYNDLLKASKRFKRKRRRLL